MNAKVVWGGGLFVFFGLFFWLVLWPENKLESPRRVGSRKSIGKDKETLDKETLDESLLSKKSRVTQSKKAAEGVQPDFVPEKPFLRQIREQESRELAKRLEPSQRLSEDAIMAKLLRLKGTARSNHPAYKAFIAEGGTDEQLENYKFKRRNSKKSKQDPVRSSPELSKKDFVVIVKKGSGKAKFRASVDIELRAHVFPGPKDMILILKHNKSLKAEGFFAHPLLQATRKKVTFQNTGTPGESLIHIRGSSDPLSSGKMLTLRFIVEGGDPSVTPIFIREISQLGVRSPNAGTVGNVMQIR